MAYLESLQEGEIKTWLEAPNFWNISSSVGYGCQNKKADVLLVQFFLNSEARFFDKESRLIVPDGTFGGKTWARVKQFQKEAGVSVIDGMVSSISGDRLQTPKQGAIYTIIVMNRYYWVHSKAYYPDIRRDPKLPAELCSIFSGPMMDL